jgi:hypothetical protein
MPCPVTYWNTNGLLIDQSLTEYTKYITVHKKIKETDQITKIFKNKDIKNQTRSLLVTKRTKT